MTTLHEEMMATKAVEYVLAAALLVLFAAFWWFLGGQRKHS